MWFPYALLAAFFYAVLWVLARAARGMPSAVVSSLQFALGPFLLIYVTRTIDYPWSEGWWRMYLVLPFLILPLTAWATTHALRTTEVTLVKPLFGLSSIATLGVSSLFFGEEVPRFGVLGILAITAGLFILYHERWHAWRQAGPWMVLAGALIFGSNAAIAAAVLRRFPHILALSALMMTGSFVFNGIAAGTSWRDFVLSRRNILLLFGLLVTLVSQDLFTLYALTLGPSSYVIAVKRTSVLLTALLGYFFLKERDQSLPRLLFSASLVVAGVAALTVG